MLTILIPDDLDQQLSGITDDKQEFIINAVMQKIIQRKKYSFVKDLAKEYADSINENEEITKEITHSDKENWNDY